MKTLSSILTLLLIAHQTLAKLVVYGPEELRQKFEDKPVIRANYANFGHIPYGQSLIGSIYFDRTNLDGCRRMDLKPQPLNETSTEGGDAADFGGDRRDLAGTTASEETFPTKILLVDRGNCTFVTKVRNAERSGASLVVVIDNVYENITNVIMGDDGTGTGIRIPSMLIGKEDGAILKDFALQHSDVRATLSAEFSVKQLVDQVEVEFFFSSNNKEAQTFIKEFSNYASKLGNSIHFKPRYVTWACPNCDSSYIEEECYSNGAYCAPNHVKDTFNQVKGQSILLEELREMCLHKMTDDMGNTTIWWEYMKYAHMECYNFIGTKCSKEGLKHVGIEYSDVKQCVDDSFQFPGRSGDNSFLAENAKRWIELGTMYWPMIVMNNMTFRGDITAENILEDICANLREKPQVCLDFYQQNNIEFEATDPSAKANNVISAEMLIIIVTVLILVNVLLICAYRRCVKKEMEDNMGFKVSSAVSQYISLAQQNRTNQSTELE